MAYCRNCGKNINSDDKFCIYCGQKNMAGDRYCPHCGGETAPDNRFCSKCGEKIIFEEQGVSSERQQFAQTEQFTQTEQKSIPKPEVKHTVLNSANTQKPHLSSAEKREYYLKKHYKMAKRFCRYASIMLMLFGLSFFFLLLSIFLLDDGTEVISPSFIVLVAILGIMIIFTVVNLIKPPRLPLYPELDFTRDFKQCTSFMYSAKTSKKSSTIVADICLIILGVLIAAIAIILIIFDFIFVSKGSIFGYEIDYTYGSFTSLRSGICMLLSSFCVFGIPLCTKKASKLRAKLFVLIAQEEGLPIQTKHL